MNNKKIFEEYYYFIHLPKTGGTSFRNMLYKQFPQEVIYPNLKDITANGGRYPSHRDAIKTLKSGRNIQFLMGHYPFVVGEQLPKMPQHIVFLRDPIKRAISNVYHLQHNNPNFKDVSARAIIESAFPQVNNFQVRFMGDVRSRPDRLYTAETKFGAKALIMAKKNIDACAFVGFTEHFKASVKTLEKKFDWKLGRKLKKNKTWKRREPIPDDALRKLIEFNQLDVEFYNYAVEKYQSLIFPL